MGTVATIWRYPVKSGRAEALAEVDVEKGGLRGDRGWACVDAEDESVGSLKHPRRWGGLLGVSAALDGDDLVVRVGEASVRAGTEEADAHLSLHLGRKVRLTKEPPKGAKLHRSLPGIAGMLPDWMAGSDPGTDTMSDLHDSGRFVDFAPLHVVTTGALAGLAERAGAPVAPIRFRPNLVLDVPRDPEPGTEFQVGEVRLRAMFPTPRCIVPSLAQQDAGADPGVLKSLAKHYRMQVSDFGRAACFGVYAEVVEPGHIVMGDPVAWN